MKPHRFCHVLSASYLLRDADVIFLFVSATAMFHARSEVDVSRVMDFAKRFEEATSANLTSLEPNKLSYHPGQENDHQIRTYSVAVATRI